jgi:uncharacterized repeat protein (TIGR03806 family)
MCHRALILLRGQGMSNGMKTIALLILTTLTMMLGCGGGDDLPTDAASEPPSLMDAGTTAPVDAVGMDMSRIDASALDASERDASALDTSERDAVTVDSPAVDVSASDGPTGDGALGWDGAAAVDASPLGCNTAALGTHPPLLLSETGCFAPGAPTQPIADFLPYEVNSPLWSDGATKERYLKVPTGSTISVKDCDRAPETCLPVAQGGGTEDEGHFDLPIGTILIKVFILQGQRIETRLLMRVSDTAWAAYSYEWNDAATDATLGLDGGNRTVGAQVWHFPSQGECTQCHTLAAGRSLGPTTQQLDRTTAAGNQLDLLVARGWLTSRPKALAPLPDPKVSGPAEQRARSYLQANCSFCHRPGSYISDMDMRYTATLFDMNVCNVQVQRGLGDPDIPQVRVAPGSPAGSAISFRMHDRTAGYTMPRIGSNLVDPTGTAVVDQWISELTACPAAASP